MKTIKESLTAIDQVRDDVALGLISLPGMSKTSQVKQWAESNGRGIVELIISQRMPTEISGMPMPIEATQRMEVFDYNTLLKLKDGDVLFLDEFTNGNVQTLNACLTLIQDRTMLSGKKLPSILVVAAGNPHGQCDLLPQTKQRFLWCNLTFDINMWCSYIEKKHGPLDRAKLQQLGRKIQDTYAHPFDSYTYNYLTCRTAENLIKLAKVTPRASLLWDDVRDFSCLNIDLIYDMLKVSEHDKVKMMALDAVHGWAEANVTSIDVNAAANEDLQRIMFARELSACKSLTAVKKTMKDWQGTAPLASLEAYLDGLA